ncbi:carbohydrate porin [Luteimonas sp. BDR2-5]|uniref:carbohydrate porin n=1 Tax=Proluteimonas luteida TaxID=2878685 RepID=UPI001E367639|nr:carbohydrate porin [Luteimonas sp. BDR2-5]MCD9029153.1 carbohydrate porin [Luteimonas sp. BDR2-5]
MAMDLPEPSSPDIDQAAALDAVSMPGADVEDRAGDPPPSGSPAAPSMDSEARAHALDAIHGYKGWNIPFPSFGDSITRDDGHWRTRMAEHGFGLSVQSIPIFQINTLDNPRRVPDYVPPCVPENLNYNCAGGRSYFGQGGDYFVSNLAYLTYDSSRWGVPDGQITFGGHWGLSSDEAYSPKTVRVFVLSWYQTLFDGKVELKMGYFPSLTEFMGTFVGGMVTNPFGPNGFLPLAMGMSPNNVSTPNVRATWHVNDDFYAQLGVQRSLPVRGATGNPIYDEVNDNASGLRFKSSVPGTRILYTGELGYKRQAAPGNPYVWVRGGGFHNTSDFTDFSRLLADPDATRKGGSGVYLLADRQVWQQAPGSPYTAYRGVYLGGTFMGGESEVAAFTRYYELRAYWLGPFSNRPRDMISLIANHNSVSDHLQDVTNAYAPYTGLFANEYANSATASYMFRVRSGVYATLGVGYTDNPSIQYFDGQGSSLNVLASMFITL